MKTKLTAEQSANLISKGVSAEKATVYRSCSLESDYESCFHSEPIFTLSNLLEILPKEITAADGEEYYFICGASYPNGDWGAISKKAQPNIGC